MLSRRSIRIKVMQVLYSMSRDPKLEFSGALENYRNSIQESFELYLFNLHNLVQIAGYSKNDLEKRSTKLLPSEEDKLFSAKLLTNDLIQSLIQNPGLNQVFDQKGFKKKLDSDSIRLFYTDFAKTNDYKVYVKEHENSHETHRKMLLALFKHCINNETYVETLEDHFPFWADDQSLIVGAMKRSIKSLPTAGTFYEEHFPPNETTVEFGEKLLDYVYHHDSDLLGLIKPTLKNWDVDRVAIIDMILLKMALAELINFPTIPTKVTLNEFVDISKQYSTDKSKDFINGILDRLMKKLEKEGKIQKQGRGLMN